ncbi:MAG: hypothetical protein NTY79_05565 [Chloroflexi bacterium]|nr:hypothetical protein [Chloroflexota bacterium]
MFEMELRHYAIFMVGLLKYALEHGRYDAAAYALIYALVKVKKDGKKQKEARKARVLPAGAG